MITILTLSQTQVLEIRLRGLPSTTPELSQKKSANCQGLKNKCLEKLYVSQENGLWLLCPKHPFHKILTALTDKLELKGNHCSQRGRGKSHYPVVKFCLLGC